LTTAYGPEFYADRRHATQHAARTILSIVAEHLPFARVADVGCGTGTWLAAAMTLGAEEAFGYEGAWIDGVALDDARIVLAQVDLERPLAGTAADLAISLEVAEHLSPERADSFVADLCAMAPAVLFGAAIPGQGGVSHVNEQWQSYWARMFAGMGYRAFDIIRPRLWSDDRIPAWYRQNAILFVADAKSLPRLSAVDDLGTLDLVHPTFWNRANRELEYANAKPESDYLRAVARS
jgi:SAM-dependent methyltransferase